MHSIGFRLGGIKTCKLKEKFNYFQLFNAIKNIDNVQYGLLKADMVSF